MAETLHEYIVYSEDVRSIDSPAFYDCCLHLLCTAGEGEFVYNDRLFSIRQGEIAVISQPRHVSKLTASKDFACEYIAAPNQFLHNLLPANSYAIQGCVSLYSNPIIRVDANDAEIFRADLQNIRRRIDDTSHQFYAGMMGGLLRTMMYDLFDFHARINDSVLTTDRVGYITSRFFTLIESGLPGIQREVTFYASQLNVSSKYLSDTIKRVTGESASTHINRAAAAVMLAYLKDNNLSITQIADEMRFSSISYFSRFCTKHLGVPPRKLRISANP